MGFNSGFKGLKSIQWEPIPYMRTDGRRHDEANSFLFAILRTRLKTRRIILCQPTKIPFSGSLYIKQFPRTGGVVL